jgi:hypothetical protein
MKKLRGTLADYVRCHACDEDVEWDAWWAGVHDCGMEEEG